MNPQKKLKTYNITFLPKDAPRYHYKTITYKADSMNEAKQKFYEEYPEQKNEDYLEIHSPLENYAIDRENQKIAETQKTNDTTNNSNTTNDAIPHQSEMKKFNILNVFKTVNDYVKEITMLLIGLIPLLLLGVVLFGDDFFLGNIVVYNIQNILDSMAGFVGIITLLLIVYFYNRLDKSK
jgi:hypothetical protein